MLNWRNEFKKNTCHKIALLALFTYERPSHRICELECLLTNYKVNSNEMTISNLMVSLNKILIKIQRAKLT